MSRALGGFRGRLPRRQEEEAEAEGRSEEGRRIAGEERTALRRVQDRPPELVHLSLLSLAIRRLINRPTPRLRNEEEEEGHHEEDAVVDAVVEVVVVAEVRAEDVEELKLERSRRSSRDCRGWVHRVLEAVETEEAGAGEELELVWRARLVEDRDGAERLKSGELRSAYRYYIWFLCDFSIAEVNRRAEQAR